MTGNTGGSAAPGSLGWAVARPVGGGQRRMAPVVRARRRRVEVCPRAGRRPPRRDRSHEGPPGKAALRFHPPLDGVSGPFGEVARHRRASTRSLRDGSGVGQPHALRAALRRTRTRAALAGTPRRRRHRPSLAGTPSKAAISHQSVRATAPAAAPREAPVIISALRSGLPPRRVQAWKSRKPMKPPTKNPMIPPAVGPKYQSRLWGRAGEPWNRTIAPPTARGTPQIAPSHR